MGAGSKNDDWMVFREYEEQVNSLIADQRSIILCTYPLATSPGDQIFDVAHIHQVAVANAQPVRGLDARSEPGS